jgi:hypothetical protein
MELLTTDELFEVLEEIAPAEVQERHLHLMMTDKNYRQQFNELRELHEGLIALSLESPSLAFENKLMNRWETIQSTYKTPVFLRLLPFFFTALLGMILLGILVLGGVHPAGSSGTENYVDYLPKGIDLERIKSLLLPVNSLLLLLIVERLVKNRWKRRLEQV